MTSEDLSILLPLLSTKVTKVDKKMLDKAEKAGYIDRTPNYNLPECECGLKLSLEEHLENGGAVYTCEKEHRTTFTKEQLLKYSTPHLNSQKALESFINEMFGEKTVKERKELEFGFGSYKITLNDNWFFISTFLLSDSVPMEEVASLALRISKQRVPWICFFNKLFYDNNKKEYYEILSAVPLGSNVISVNINEWLKPGKEVNGVKLFSENLEKYKVMYNQIKESEDKLLEKDNLKDLVYNVDTNPKLILSLTTRFMFDRSSLNWQDFQNLAKIAFSIMYHSNKNDGARPSVHEPDFMFRYIEETTSGSKIEQRGAITHFFGIGDCKLLGVEKAIKLTNETTEKYLDYLHAPRQNWEAEVDKVVELIIFYSSDFSPKAGEFVDRLYESGKLTRNDFIVFFDTWAFLPFITKYLSIIVKSTKYNEKKKPSEEGVRRPEDLLHPETVKKNFAQKTKKGNIYYLVGISALEKLYPQK